MPAIRLAPRDTSFEQPAMAETQFADYAHQLVYDGLYHSPVWSVGRWTEARLEKADISSGTMSAEDATKTYGLDGELKFTEPVPEKYASLLYDRKLAELRREYELESGSINGWGRKISGFGVSLVSTVIDPVNLASAFIPVVGESRYLQGGERAAGFLQRGLISPKSLARVVGTSKLGYRLGKGAVEGLVGSALVEPLNLIPALEEQAHYNWKDSAMNLGFGATVGAGLHGVGGWISDKLTGLHAGLKNIDPQTHEAAVMAGVTDIVQDKPLASPADVVSVDQHVITSQLQEVNTENLFKIAQEHLDRLNQLPNPTPAQEVRKKLIGAILANPTSASPENLAHLFELKLNEGVDKMPRAFNFIGEKKPTPVKYSNSGFERLYNEVSSLKIEDGHQVVENAIHARDSFKEVIHDLQQHGYDIINEPHELKYGKDSVVFITKDKVIKISDAESGGEHIAGVSNDIEHEFSNADFTATVESRVTTLSDLNMHSADMQSAIHAVEVLAKYYGLTPEDLHAGNIGIDSSGNFKVIDRDTFKNYGGKNVLPVKMLIQQLGKGADKEKIGLIVQGLLRQIEEQKAKVQESTQARIQEIIQRRKQESSQKVLDSEQSLAKTDGIESVKSEPEPLINYLTREEEQAAISDLESEVGELEKSLEDLEVIKALNEDVKKVNALKKAVDAGVVCMTGKSV